MTTQDILKKIALENDGIILTKTAQAHDVSRAMLSYFAKTGELVRVASGQYVFSDALEDELKVLCNRYPSFVFSHETALFLNEISERTPFEHSVTMPSTQRVSPLLEQQCKVYYVKPELHALGKTTRKTTQGVEVPCYDIDRTVCDIIRSRNRVAEETFFSSLKLYTASSHKNLSNLQKYAAAFGITKTVRHYMEVLL